ncbi:DUF2059 domain-containing protein [Mariluticola halotolerans]|uniref:DUF2059 domain-containing protein n=1 Tax=Mariluticola halotolerans TaxID=2909283 RepID=UPI0026E14D35|nr:DUF2059 domain-containing protein [Mariluticola halotolerans]UJQ94794.1 DUF2059 domain-containing protein [Mariluticola halotolerans]
MKRTHKLNSILCVVSAAWLLAAAPLAAQELSPEQLDLARKYVELTDRSQVYEVSVVQTGIDALKTLVSQNPSVGDEINTAIGDTVKSYNGRKNELIDQFARIYAARFTVEELQTIVDFYSSDVGQKLSKENFEANRQISTVLSIFQQNLRVEFLAQVRATLKERGIDI